MTALFDYENPARRLRSLFLNVAVPLNYQPRTVSLGKMLGAERGPLVGLAFQLMLPPSVAEDGWVFKEGEDAEGLYVLTWQNLS